MLAINWPTVSFADGPETNISKVPSMVCLEDWFVTIVACALSLSNPALIVGDLKVLCIVNPPVTSASLEKEPDKNCCASFEIKFKRSLSIKGLKCRETTFTQ